MKFSSHLLIKSTKPDLILEISNPQKDLLVWLTAVGKYSVINDTNGNRRGELKYKEKVYAFEIEKKDLIYRAKFYNTELEPILQGLLKRVFYKNESVYKEPFSRKISPSFSNVNRIFFAVSLTL